jgi:hypothetical protein
MHGRLIGLERLLIQLCGGNPFGFRLGQCLASPDLFPLGNDAFYLFGDFQHLVGQLRIVIQGEASGEDMGLQLHLPFKFTIPGEIG